MIEVSDKATYYNNRNLRLRSKLVQQEVEDNWVNWIVDEQDRIDVLRIVTATRRIHERKVIACAAVENAPSLTPLQDSEGESRTSA